MVIMYITSVPNRNSPPAILLRESYREEGRVKTRTLANLSHLPTQSIELLRRQLKGEKFVSVNESFEKVESWHHGHVDAVRRAMNRLDFDRLIYARRCPERDLVVAMVMGRILEPDNNKNSKLANPRWWQMTTLPSMLEVDGATEDDLYIAMDWLLGRQASIEKKLAKRHLRDGGQVLFDLSSSYFEGTTCPLAAIGNNRDGKKGKKQVNWGLLADSRGCPVAVSVFKGNTADTKTLMPQVEKIRKQFKIESMALVGDRGMITQKLIDDALCKLEGVDWITALRSGTIRKMVQTGHVQLGLFDEQNLFELTHSDFPGERLVACRNPELAKLRGHKRQSLLRATVDKLEEIRVLVERGKLRGKEKIERRINKVVKQYRVVGHFSFTVREDGFEYQIDDTPEAAKSALRAFCSAMENVNFSIKQGKLKKEEIKKETDKLINRYNLAAHVTVERCDDGFSFQINNSKKAAQAAFGRVLSELDKVKVLIEQGKYGGKDSIGVRVGKVINKYKMAKHIELFIRDDGFDFQVNSTTIENETALDGIYVIRTSVSSDYLSASDTVRSYKNLSQVERAFRSLKTVDLKIRPIRHRLEDRVRAHIFLCMLAYYVEWHMREVWRPLLFADEDLEAKKTRDPVAPAKRSDAALKKVHTRTLEDNTETHSFQTLLKLLSGIVRNLCRPADLDAEDACFEIVTTPTPKQQKALNLLDTIEM